MIKCIAAIDEQRGLANDAGIPWQGKVPSDVKHFREATQNGTVLMGYKTYEEFAEALPGRRNLVATHTNEPMRPGFEALPDARDFLQETVEDVWVIGGAGLFASVLDLVDELDLTELEGSFGCTKFFPEFHELFEKTAESEPKTENGITLRFTTWRRKQTKSL